MKKKSQKLKTLPKGAIPISEIGSYKDKKKGENAEDRLISPDDSVTQKLDARGFDVSYIPSFRPLRTRRMGMVKSWKLGYEAFRKWGNARDVNYWLEMLRSDEKGRFRELENLYLESLKHLFGKKADWVVSLVMEAQSNFPGAIDELLGKIRQDVLFQIPPDEPYAFIKRVSMATGLLKTKIRKGTRSEDRFRATFYCFEALWKKFLAETPSKINRAWLRKNLPSRKEVETFLKKIGKKMKDDPEGKHAADFFSGPILSLCMKAGPWGNS